MRHETLKNELEVEGPTERAPLNLTTCGETVRRRQRGILNLTGEKLTLTIQKKGIQETLLYSIREFR